MGQLREWPTQIQTYGIALSNGSEVARAVSGRQAKRGCPKSGQQWKAAPLNARSGAFQESRRCLRVFAFRHKGYLLFVGSDTVQLNARVPLYA